MPGTYEGKTGLVLGVANRRSIAWAIAAPIPLEPPVMTATRGTAPR